MKRPTLPALCASIFLTIVVSCNALASQNDDNAEDKPTDEEVIAIYNHYINADFALYVDQMESLDHKPDFYRKQMADLMKQRHRQQEELHGGLQSCRVIKTQSDPNGKYCNIYLEVTYTDRAFDEILLQMVKANGTWRLK